MTPALIWLDLETTGLDPQRDWIVEVGIVLTDGELNKLAENTWVVFVPPTVWTRIDPYVFAMHNFSGLRQESMFRGHGRDQVEKLVIRWLTDQGVASRALPMAGSTIGFDRSFLSCQMSDIHQFAHHRSLDVSTLNIVASLMAQKTHEARPQKRGAHRPIADLEDSIDTLRYYRDNLIRRDAA